MESYALFQLKPGHVNTVKLESTKLVELNLCFVECLEKVLILVRRITFVIA